MISRELWPTYRVDEKYLGRLFNNGTVILASFFAPLSFPTLASLNPVTLWERFTSATVKRARNHINCLRDVCE